MPRRRKGAQHVGGVSAAFGEPSSGPAGSAACQDRQERGTGFDETWKLMNSAANGRSGLNSSRNSKKSSACPLLLPPLPLPLLPPLPLLLKKKRPNSTLS